MSLAEQGSAGIVFNARSLARSSQFAHQNGCLGIHVTLLPLFMEQWWDCSPSLGQGRGAESETNAHHERRALRVMISGRNDVLMLKV